EKRDFFLENAGIFEFGQRGTFEPPPFQLFFSRSIGIDPDSGAIPMLGGARLSGRMGRQTLGFLSAATAAKYGDPRTLFNVARVKRDVGGANYVGAMLVDRRNDNASNTAGGADFSFWPRNALNVQGFVARTGTSGAGGDDLSYRLGADYQTNRLGVTTSHLYVGPEVNAEAGFVPRVDIHRTQSNWRLTQRPTALNLRRINYNLWLDHVADADWRRLDWSVTAGIRPIWNTEDGFGLFRTVGRNRINESFTLADTVLVPAGDYLYRTTSLFASTGRSRAVILDFMGDLQEIFGGRVNKVTTSATTAAGTHLALRTSYTFSHADLPRGTFDVHLVSLRAAWTFSTRVALNSLVQYNSLARRISANLRLNIIHRPGSDIFLVLNEERGSELSAWDPGNRAVRLKVTYLARF
ncbi:MAG TPA: hypothetical protein VFV33_14160, partial [Gemmatimonadaceae bacterium]|nr:hypothetical protein [Gemmatimonadaceae bacterium]